mmetsp:Transcript_9527/g.11775  ORF Transcript_9527/g.11775 Transcript_9527/m.11775 type:complete len:140 (-) Transcript_9527:535-954(-)
MVTTVYFYEEMFHEISEALPFLAVLKKLRSKSDQEHQMKVLFWPLSPGYKEPDQFMNITRRSIFKMTATTYASIPTSYDLSERGKCNATKFHYEWCWQGQLTNNDLATNPTKINSPRYSGYLLRRDTECCRRNRTSEVM